MDDSSGDRFPIGMRVLAVDDDPMCLLVLEKLLTKCQYHVTTTNQAIKALSMLRENKDKFDLVISDVHMPDMDGFKLLELVGLEMDLPVIMLSAYGDTKLVMKGISHGACDYLLKPVRLEELKNIWQHVLRKKKSDPKEKRKASNPDKPTSDSGNVLGSSAGTGNSDENGKLTKKRKDQDEDEDEEKENGADNEDSSNQKKPRVVWTVDLHRKFVAAVNQLGIDKAVPKKILDMMNVETLTRENVASHLQKYRLYLKRISVVANQQACMVAALGSADQSYLRMGSLSGIGQLQTLSGSGQFHNNGFNSFSSSSGIVNRLNTPAGLNVHGFPSSGVRQLGQSQNSNNFKFQSAITPGNQNGLQGMPMSTGFDHLQNSKGVISVQNFSTDVDSTFPISNILPDQRPRVSISGSHPLNLSVSNNALMLGTHPQGKQGGMGYGSSSSTVASQHPDFSYSNWPSAVQLSGIQTSSFSPTLGESFTQTAIPPKDNMASLPLQIGYSGGQSVTPLFNQSHGTSADMPSQGVTFTTSAEYINSNASFQGWVDHNQDATYHSSVNSLPPVNGAVLSAGHITANSTLHTNLDMKFCDPLQVKHDGFVDLTEGSSSRQPWENIINHRKSQHNRFSSNLGSLEYFVGSMMDQEQDKMKSLGGGDLICDSYSGEVSL